MEEKENPVVPPTAQPSTVEQLDYSKEFESEVAKFENADRNREGYSKRKATEPKEPVTPTAQPDIAELVRTAIASEIQNVLPKLQATMAEDSIDTILNGMTTDESKKKLIKFHFENSVGTYGTLRERLENAELIADKKLIQKKQQEMAVTITNRQGLNHSPIGSSTEGAQVKDNFFSEGQLQSLKARGFDDKKIERLKANMRKNS